MQQNRSEIWLIGTGVLAIQAIVLLLMGQPPICTCGTVKLWHGAVQSAENSQHLTDWYTFSHVIHGILFYAVLSLIAPRSAWTVRLVVAMVLEMSWEILENSPVIVERYRQSALAQGYAGDSIINSLSDNLAMVGGFLLARTLPRPATIALVVALELGVAYFIRDNLTLNIIQLVHPSQAISDWQAGR